MIRLTIYRDGGPPMSGVYHWTEALERLDFSRHLSHFTGFTFTAPDGRP